MRRIVSPDSGTSNGASDDRTHMDWNCCLLACLLSNRVAVCTES